MSDQPLKTLHLESASNYQIKDETGAVLSLEEARALWEGGKLKDYNLAFGRLATQFDFDLDRLKQYYARGSRA